MVLFPCELATSPQQQQQQLKFACPKHTQTHTTNGKFILATNTQRKARQRDLLLNKCTRLLLLLAACCYLLSLVCPESTTTTMSTSPPTLPTQLIQQQQQQQPIPATVHDELRLHQSQLHCKCNFDEQDTKLGAKSNTRKRLQPSTSFVRGR